MNDNCRERTLLDAFCQFECALQIDNRYVGGFGDAALSNHCRRGKRGSLKAHDCFVASAYRSCHHELDRGTRFTREEKVVIWLHGDERTMLALWQVGLIHVGA